MNIPTAEEYYSKTMFPTLFKYKPDEIKLWFETNPDAQQSVNIMIEFAKLHVQAALKAASENVEVDYNLLEDYNKTLLVDENIEVYAITSSILDSYSLENIK